MQTKSFTVQIKAGPEDGLDDGQFIGYASVFGNVDSYGDIVQPGAFAKSLKVWEKSGSSIPVLWAHDTRDPFSNIGYVIKAEEDARGLKVLVQLDTEGAKAAQIHRLLKGGRISQMSFAYDVIDGRQSSKGYELHEMKLHEVSVVPVGANQETEIVSVKSENSNLKQGATPMSKYKNFSDEELESEFAETYLAFQNHRESTVDEVALKAEFESRGKDYKREKAIAEGEHLIKAMDSSIEVRPSDEYLDAKYNRRGDSLGGGSHAKEPFTMTRSSFAKSAATMARKSMQASHSKGVSTILPGAQIDSPILSNGIQELGRQTNSFLELLSTESLRGRHFSYARQNSRTNNAAIVRPGEVKPTSAYGIEMISGETLVIAHLSEPIDEFILRDVDGLNTVLAHELTYGLWDTLDNQIVNGTGPKVSPTANQITGILATPGIQTQAFTSDALTTIRTSFTKLRQVGRTPEAVSLNPADWQALELLRATTGGEFLLGNGGPIDAAKRTLWGVQVVESFAVPVGTAIIMQRDAAKVIVSEPGTIISWHTSGDGFETNTTRLRVEMRANLAVKIPDAIVKATITGA